MKRRPIKKELRKIVLIISMAAIMLTCTVALLSMFHMKSISENSLIDQMKQNLGNIVGDKAENAGLKLSRYANYINLSADYIEGMYADPDSFARNEVLPPDAAMAGKYSMQRYPIDKSVKISDIEDELALLGNIESIWAPMMNVEGEFITTVYVGAESGFLISYDRNADLGVTEGSKESYYDFRDAEWYISAQENGGEAFFTYIYPDSYGRGLTISCASPFYRNGEFAGVVCMDILVTDLQKDAIDIDLGEGAYAFLVDKAGRIIASPYISLDQTEFESILSEDSPLNKVSSDIMRGVPGIEKTGDSVYCAYAPVGQADWKLCVRIPENIVLSGAEGIRKSIRGSLYAFDVVIVLVLIAVAILVAKFSGKLTRPISRLREDVSIISGGDLDHKAERVHNDEIGDLAESFNGMTDSLKEHIEQLTTVTREKERIGAELDVAAHIQLSMLPCIFPAFSDREEFDIYATMDPAKEVGGDFYDFFMVDSTHLALVIADVSGKGVPAALFMVIGKTLIKDHTEPGTDLGDVFSKVNDMLCESNSEGLFITAFECVLDLETGELRYVNAGHNPPLLRRAGEGFEYLKTKRALVLAGMEGMKYRSGEMTLNEGDELYLYTDGITEATDTNEELYGETRLQACLCSAEYSDCEQLCRLVKEDTDRFVGEAPQFDDMTMLAFKFKNKYGNPDKKAAKSIVMDAVIESIPAVTEFADGLLEEAGCSVRAQMQIDVAIDEVFSNIALYAYKPGKGTATVEIDIGGEPQTATLTFIDSGIPFNPLEKEDPDITLEADRREIGGLGIFMVKKTMDDVSYERKDGCNILTLRKVIE